MPENCLPLARLARRPISRRAALVTLGSSALAARFAAADELSPAAPPGDQTPPVDRLTRFALIGDTPYTAADQRNLRRVLKAAASEADFVIHAGDFKRGRHTCDQSLFEQRIALLDASPRPLVFVPGDNEWVDCTHAEGGPFDPLERLRLLRALVYHGRTTLGGDPPLVLQRPAFRRPDSAARTQVLAATTGMPDPFDNPEYMRWRAGPCLFVTLNVPGSHNGLDTDIPAAAHRTRAAHNSAWLLDSMRRAEALEIPGLVVVLHAEIDLPDTTPADNTADVMDRSNPYAWVRALISHVSANFAGTVLVLYGDRHHLISDHPLTDLADRISDSGFAGVPASTARDRLRRLQRIQVYGSPFSAQYLIVRLWTDRDNPLKLRSLVAARVA